MRKPYDPAYYQKYKSRIRKHQRKHYLKYKQKYQLYSKNYAIKNRKRLNKIAKIWKLKNKDKVLNYYKRYINKNKNNPIFKERRKAIYKKWALRYPLKEKLCKRLSLIKQRCINKKYKDYPRYGGKGIKCLLSWKDLIFIWRRDKASKMKCPSVDRINPKGNYILENCRFIEKSENVARAHRGIKHDNWHKHKT